MSALPATMNCAKSDRPLRIAFVYSRLPFPMMRGDQLTVAHLLGFLAERGHEVDFYTLRVQGELTDAQSNWLAEKCRSVRMYTHGLTKMLRGLTYGLLKGEPAQVAIFRNKALTVDVQAAVTAGAYDLVYCYYIRSAHAVPDSRETEDAPVTFLAMQLSQSLNSQRIFENEKNWLKRLFYRFETALCQRYEARIWQRFDRSVLIGPADVEKVRAVCVSEGQREIDNWVYGAHGTDIHRYQPASPEEIIPGRVIFSGSMLYQPNIQAVLWFVEQCWPQIRLAVPNAELIIQGRDPTSAVLALDGTDGIVVTGTVPDVSKHIRTATVCINPMRAAGGMQNKLIEYMACAKPIVATSIANEGVLAPEGTLRIADDPEDFAAAVVELLGHPELGQALGSAARHYVEENWSWESHFLRLEQSFYDVLDIPIAAEEAVDMPDVLV